MATSKQTEIQFFNIKQPAPQGKIRLSSPVYDSSIVHSDGEHKITSGGNDDNMFQTMPINKNTLSANKRNFRTTSVMPQTNSKPELGGWVSNTKPPMQSKSKLELTRQISPPQQQRSNSAHNIIRVKPRDIEDLKHSLHRLKIDFNQTNEENLKLKTRNTQLENLVNTLYNDLHTQQVEIQKMYSGKSGKPQFLQTSIASGLKRQLREERTSVKSLTDELEALKKSLRMTTQTELNLQVQLYQDECLRLRTLLEQELVQSQKNVVAMAQNHFNILSITSEEDRRRIMNQFTKKDNDLKEQSEQITKLKSELELVKKRSTQGQKQKQNTDLQNRQAQLIKTKGTQIKQLSDQLAAAQAKLANNERQMQRNLDLTKLNNELQRKIGILEKTLQEQLPLDQAGDETPSSRGRFLTLTMFSNNSNAKKNSPPLQLGDHGKLGRQMSMMPLERKSSKFNGVSDNQQQSKSPTHILQQQMTFPLSKSNPAMDNKILSSPTQMLDQKIEEVVPESKNGDSDCTPPPIRRLTKYELLTEGFAHFRAMVDKKPQPGDDFFKDHNQEMQHFYRKLKQTTLSSSILQKILGSRVTLAATTLLEQINEIIESWNTTLGSEVQVCKAICSQVIPAIKNELVDMQLVYDRIDLLLNTHSEDSVASQEIGSSQKSEEMIGDEEEEPEGTENVIAAPQGVGTTLSHVEERNEESPQLESKQSSQKPHESQHYSSVQESESGEPTLVELPNQSQQNSEPNETVDSPGQNNSITEEQMLDTAEQILSELAQKLIQNGWSVHDVFGQPDEIIRVIQEFESESNIKVLTPQNFLGRVYQAGIQDLTQLQVACLMRVLGKPEFDDSVRYDELELLLENFGVLKDGGQESVSNPEMHTPTSENLQIIEDESMSVNEPQGSDGGILFIDDTRPNFEFSKKQNETTVPEQIEEQQISEDLYQQDDYYEDQEVSEDKPQANINLAVETSLKNTFQKMSQPTQDQKRPERPSDKKEPHHLVSRQTSGETIDKIPSAQNLDLESPGLQKLAEEVTPTFKAPVASNPEKPRNKFAFAAKGVVRQQQVTKVIQSLTEAKREKIKEEKVHEEEVREEEVLQSAEPEQQAQAAEPEQVKEAELKVPIKIQDSRAQTRLQIIQPKQESAIFKMFSEILQQISVSELLTQLEQRGYKQVIKSKTRSTETSIITEEAFFELISEMTEVKLSPEELDSLRECVQLTPKFQHLFTLKLLAILISEVELKGKTE